MKFLFSRDTWMEVFDSINKNRGRTFITVTGVIWGIFIYIVLSGSAQGLENGFLILTKGSARNSMFMWTRRTTVPYEGYKIGRVFSLKQSDAVAIKAAIPEIKYISPRAHRGLWGDTPVLVSYKQRSERYPVIGDTEEYIKIFNKKIFEGGRFFNKRDLEEKRNVCIITEQNEQDLFDKDEDPVGKFIKIENTYFEVIGVQVDEESIGVSSGRDIIIPFSTFQKIYNRGDRVGWFAIAAHDYADSEAVEEDVMKLMKKRHSVHPDDNVAIGFANVGKNFKKFMGFAKGLTFLSTVVGMATVLAGAIGIGNILLITVKERTKEFGVRRALGAKPIDIKGQIVLESSFLTITAGTVGIILGSLVLTGIQAIASGNDDIPYANPTVPIHLVILCLVIMVTLGSLIGLIPAQKATSIKPIDALREE